MSSLNDLWKKILEGDTPQGVYGLINVSLDAYNDQEPQEGDIKLILNIIKQAAIDKDFNYFNSLAFKEHCWLTRLNKTYIMQIVKNTWG